MSVIADEEAKAKSFAAKYAKYDKFAAIGIPVGIGAAWMGLPAFVGMPLILIGIVGAVSWYFRTHSV